MVDEIAAQIAGGSGYSIKIGGLDDLRNGLQVLKTALTDWVPFWRYVVIPHLVSQTEKRFAEHVTPWGASWQGLSERYLKSGKKVGRRDDGEVRFPGADDILKRTGSLYEALTEVTDHTIRRVERRWMEYGVEDWPDRRAAAAMYGGEQAQSAGSGAFENTPARPFLGLSDDDIEFVGRRMLDRIEEALGVIP